jgi:hypothetical protein
MMHAKLRGALALVLLAGGPARSSADELQALLLDASDARLSQVDAAQIDVRLLGDSVLLLSPGDTVWPTGLQPHASHGDDLLFLLEARDHGAPPAIAGVSPLQSSGGFQLVRCENAAIEALASRSHLERLALIRPKPPRRDALDFLSRKQLNPAVKAAIVGAVDASRLELYVRELSGDQSFTLKGQTVTIPERYTHRPGVDVAADYLQDRFESWGYDNVVRQDFLVSSTTAQNVIAVKTGTLYPDEIIVVGAHYDSISFVDDISGPAPGAEDNGSGTAAVMHLAELFKDYETERTIHFVLFSGEEEGLFGSYHYVDNATTQGDFILAALTMDMMSAHQSNYRIDIEGWNASDDCNCWPLMLQFENEINAVSPSLLTIKTYPGFGSDHVPFHLANIPTLLAIESDYASYPGYHRTTDTAEKLDFAFGGLVIRGMAATLAELSVPSAGVPVLLTDFALSNETAGIRLSWHIHADAEAGFLRLDRAVADAGFSPVSGARWRLDEEPGGFVDRVGAAADGLLLRYRLVWERDGSDAILDERETRFDLLLPAGLTLYAAEPNPFAASGGTLLRFQLPRAGAVQLDLYDAAGRHLRRLLDGARAAGPHAIRWNGRDKQGRTVASGIYFARLRTDEEQRTRRLTLLGSAP